ncbi:MAG: hypothetical protein HY401_03255 [Elusimicrobia bacterium]|nr:hypothetical protein [Elusimicrobiota bacterium]
MGRTRREEDTGYSFLFFLSLSTVYCLLSTSFLLQAAELRLEFIPTHNGSWRNFMMVDTLAKSVFPQLNLVVIPGVASKEELQKLPKEQMEETKVHLAVQKRSPALYRRYLQLASLGPMSLPWRDLVAVLGVDPSEIEREIVGEQGEKLVAGASLMPADGLKLTIEGKEIPIEFNFGTLAKAINEHLPAGERVSLVERKLTQTVPSKPEVEILVISGRAWAPWAVVEEQVLESLKRLPVGTTVREIDGRAPEAQAILKDINFPIAPVVLLKPLSDEAAKNLEGYVRQGALEVKGKKKNLYAVRGLSSSGVLWQKKEKPEKDLQLFLMSQCPYGVSAQKALLTAEKEGKMPAGTRLSFHYIVDKTPGAAKGPAAFNSLHGAGELEENARQMVLQKYQPEKLRCYLEKRLASIDSSFWDEALEACGVDLAGFKSLYKEKSQGLLDADYALTESLNFKSSPTFLWKGRYVLSGLGSLSRLEEFKGVDFTQAGAGASTGGKCQ